jgi:hypothetical protein
VMGALVDHDKEGVVGKGAQQVGCAEDDPPGAVLYQPGHGHLEPYEAQDSEEGILILADKFSDLRMLLKDLFGTEPVGLGLHGMNKISSL